MTRRDRIILLLQTYPDVREYSQRQGETRPAGKPGYKHLVRQGLWAEGSYAELERSISRLRAHYPRLARHLTAHYFKARGMAGHEINQARVSRAVDILEHWMPRNVYVPQALTENAGLIGEKTARPRRRAA